jgi:hypothetical protein
MKRLQPCLAWFSTLLMITANIGWEACGGKETAPTAAAQPLASSAAPGSATAPAPQSQAPKGQPQRAQQQQNAMQLPEVNLTPGGLDELLAPVALYPDPVLALRL